MNRNTTILTATLIALLAATAATAQPARPLDPTCKIVIDAMAKQHVTPTHIYATESERGGKPRTNEMIYSGDAIYIQVKGRWKRSPLSVQGMKKQQEENLRNAQRMTCRYLRDEAAGGEAAAVYQSSATTPAGKSSSTLWVSKRTGLPLRSETDIDTGDKDVMHMAMRYEYNNVQPPPGVK
jgi:hypothetical protein